MKKFIAGIISASLILGSGTAIMAAGNDSTDGLFNFGQMKPQMEEMHPDLTNQELKEMYESCHGTNGAKPSKNFNGMDGMMS